MPLEKRAKSRTATISLPYPTESGEDEQRFSFNVAHYMSVNQVKAGVVLTLNIHYINGFGGELIKLTLTIKICSLY